MLGYLWGEVRSPGKVRQAAMAELNLRIQGSVSTKRHVSGAPLSVGMTQLYFDVKAFLTASTTHWGLIRKWNAPVRHAWVHCHCHLSTNLVRYAVFLGKWDFLSVDIMNCYSFFFFWHWGQSDSALWWVLLIVRQSFPKFWPTSPWHCMQGIVLAMPISWIFQPSTMHCRKKWSMQKAWQLDIFVNGSSIALVWVADREPAIGTVLWCRWMALLTS